MACFVGKLVAQPEMKNPTVVVVTDRNDLDSQLYQTFVGARGLLLEEPIQIEDCDDLRQKLMDRQTGGILFTTIQKFSPEKGENRFPQLSPRENIVVIADEAHRSQYGLEAKLNKNTGKYMYGFATHLRDALPNATFVGFTGTPIESADKDTRAIFGDYISIYDIQDAVDDGATVPLYYESRLAKLDINKAEIEQLNEDVEEVLEDEESLAERESTKSKWSQLADIERPNLGILSDAFPQGINDSPNRNFALELLQRLLNDEVKARARNNVVQEQKYSDRLQASLKLIALAKEFREAAGRGDKLGLTPSELAFYDALTNNESAVREMQDDTLKALAQELTPKLRSSTTVDWQKRESVRARLRNLVRITLRRHKYPPEKAEEAIQLVLTQAERLADDWSQG